MLTRIFHKSFVKYLTSSSAPILSALEIHDEGFPFPSSQRANR